MEGVAAVWTTADLKDVEANRVAELTAEEMSVRDIAAEMGISKSHLN